MTSGSPDPTPAAATSSELPTFLSPAEAKGVLRAHGWLNAGGNRDVKCATTELIDALAEDVILFASEIDRLRRAETEAFARRVVDRLGPHPGDECPAKPPSNMESCQKRTGHGGIHGDLDGRYGWR